MSREAHIPLVLWITAAIVGHLAGGGGAVEVATTVLDRASIREAVRAERSTLHPPDTVFEVLTDDTPVSPSPSVAPPTKDGEETSTDKPDDDATNDDTTVPKPEKKKPEKEKPKVEEPKAETAKVEPKLLPKPILPLPMTPVAPAPPPPPQPPVDHRIAIRQHVEKDQKDNPDAQRIADDANTVKEETVAKIRSHDQDSSRPTPGNAPGSRSEEGDSDHTKVADSEDHKGNEKRAPGESDDNSTSATHSNPAAPTPANAPEAKAPPPSAPGGKGGKEGAMPAVEGGPPASPGGAGPASPEVANGGEKSNWSMDPANPGGDGKSRLAGKKRNRTSYQTPVHVDSMGLNGSGVPGGPNLNLNMKGVEKAVGEDKLKQERAADGAARRSAHMGSHRGKSWDQMRAAIENYEPSAKPGNMTALNAARVPFATYLNSIHNRLHPIFADEQLAWMNGLPKNSPLNDQSIVMVVEIVLSKDQGRVVRSGVTKNSGSTEFDAIALNSIDRAQPFGKAPDIIASPDGLVYLHWEFHRDPFEACSTRNARPIILKEAPKLTPSATGAPPKGPKPLVPTTDERPGSAPGPLRPLHE